MYQYLHCFTALAVMQYDMIWYRVLNMQSKNCT